MNRVSIGQLLVWLFVHVAVFLLFWYVFLIAVWYGMLVASIVVAVYALVVVCSLVYYLKNKGSRSALASFLIGVTLFCLSMSDVFWDWGLATNLYHLFGGG
jgi:hypothetical protein